MGDLEGRTALVTGASKGIGAATARALTGVAPGGVVTDFAMGRGRTPDMPGLDGMALDVGFRPVSVPSAGWGIL